MQLISEQQKFVLITIPKNACVTLNYWFDYLEHGNADELEKIEIRPKGNIHKRCRRLYTNKPIKEEYLKFAVLRNPWIRVASAFFEKIVDKQWLSSLQIKCIGDFIHFLQLIDVDHQRCNQHWKSQYTFFPKLKIDKFLKVENLKNDFNTMVEMIGIQSIQLPNWKKSAAREANYRGLYSVNEAKIVNDIYSKDVELGNYTCPDYMIDPQKTTPLTPSLSFKLRVYVDDYAKGRRNVKRVRKIFRKVLLFNKSIKPAR